MQEIGHLEDMKVNFSHIISLFFFFFVCVCGGEIGVHLISVIVGLGAPLGYNTRYQLWLAIVCRKHILI